MRPPRSRIAAALSLSVAAAVVWILAISAGSALAQDKGRVPKPKSTPPPSTPPPATPQAPQAPKDDQSDSENLGACVGGCFSFLGGLFGEDESKTSTAAPATSRAEALVPAGGAMWNVHDRAWLKGAATSDSVVLWADPYDPQHADVEAARLPVGTAVTIIERHEMSDRLELRVVRADDIRPIGWVPSTALASSPAEAIVPRSAPADTTAKPPAAAQHTGPWWGFRLAPGFGFLASGDLQSEYDPGFHIDVGYSREVGRHLPLGLSAGFWSMNGHPQFDYRTPTVLETPENSTFRLASLTLDFGVRAGGAARQPVFFLTVGPALYYVHEDADVQTTIFVVTPPDTTAVPGPSRSESLDRVAGGGVVRTGFAWMLDSSMELGLQFGLNAVAWDGHREKSLTSDYTHNGIYVCDVSLELTFGGH